MMYLPFNGNGMLSTMRDLRRPASMAEICYHMSLKYPYLTQSIIVDGVAFLLRVGWLNTLIIKQGERFSVSDAVYHMELREVPQASLRTMSIALKNVSLMKLLAPLSSFDSEQPAAVTSNTLQSHSDADEFFSEEEWQANVMRNPQRLPLATNPERRARRFGSDVYISDASDEIDSMVAFEYVNDSDADQMEPEMDRYGDEEAETEAEAEPEAEPEGEAEAEAVDDIEVEPEADTEMDTETDQESLPFD